MIGIVVLRNLMESGNPKMRYAYFKVKTIRDDSVCLSVKRLQQVLLIVIENTVTFISMIKSC
jgi:hypothetical protein